jgi:CheY-like chemotaxis protein
MKLLLVDDDAFLRDLYATKFTQSGHEVEVAESGAAAVAVMEQTPEFDVVLLDMIMPGMTGVELIQTIHEEFPEQSLKCIVLSNQGQDQDVQEAKAAGAIGYIIKAETVPSDVVKRVETLVTEAK